MKTKILKINFSNNFIAICAMLIAVVSVTLMSTIAKLIGPEYNPVQIAFIRGIIVIILCIHYTSNYFFISLYEKMNMLFGISNEFYFIH